MDRRSLLALASSMIALGASPAAACSVALKSPRSAGLENQQVRKLFEAWWQRDADQFRRVFTHTLMADGTAMEAKLASEMRAIDPVPEGAFAIFDRFFTDQGTLKRTTIIVNTDAGVFVACSETYLSPHEGSDCSGTPKLHLFLVTMSTLNARSVVHLATTTTTEPDKFGIWTEGST